MTPTITAVPVHSSDSRKHLFDVLPHLRALDDASAVNALLELYDLGVTAGVERSEGAMTEMAQYLSRLVVAHIKNDSAAVARILDEFMAARCIVKGGPDATPAH